MTTLFQKTITYYPVTFTRTKGVPTKVVGSASTFLGTTQPVTGKDLESLPAGRDDIGMIKVYSDTQLNVSIAETNNSGDLVVHNNQNWEIVKELAYQNDLIEHYKYIAELRV